jgi:hypothetical protein
MNLIEGLQEEIKRVKEIIKVYEDPILNSAGMFAATMMKGSVKKAENAIAQMDTVAMLSAIKDMKEYEL